VVSHGETLYVHGPGRLTVVDGNRIGARNVYGWSSDQAWDWGELPSPVTRDALSLGSRLFLATDRGLGVLRGMSLTTVRDRKASATKTRPAWRTASRTISGLARARGDPHGGRAVSLLCRKTLAARRPGGGHRRGRREVFLATAKGLGILRYEPYTLLKKAAYYEQHLEQWGQKRLGFVHKLEWDEATGEFVRE